MNRFIFYSVYDIIIKYVPTSLLCCLQFLEEADLEVYVRWSCIWKILVGPATFVGLVKSPRTVTGPWNNAVSHDTTPDHACSAPNPPNSGQLDKDGWPWISFLKCPHSNNLLWYRVTLHVLKLYNTLCWQCLEVRKHFELARFIGKFSHLGCDRSTS